ncbi:MAG: DGQHR domain-containing protein [Bacilli bacterium]|nr:DGQHR domain-containing protein [Bacilli bacterium]
MKKIYLLEVKQNKETSYLGSASARDLVKMATKAEFDEVQDAQRPVNPKRLDSIAEFVSNGGTLSTSIVIGTCDDNRLYPKKVEDSEIDNLYYTEFPETKEEFEKYKNCFDIMDGQHRLFSFLEEKIKIDDSVDYDLAFNMYVTPSLRTRRLIFKNTNEEQKQVESNLLLWFRKQLNMLSDKEKTYHEVVELLNTENSSPLKGRIIMGGEKIVGGFKAEQIINILAKSKIKFLGGNELSDEITFKLLSEYLCGWEDAVGIKITDRDKNYAPFSKIAGFRFMILMLPTLYDKAVSERELFNRKYVSSTIKRVTGTECYIPSDLFNPDGNYIKSLGLNPFGGETPTTVLAEDWCNKIKNESLDDFNPFNY